MPPGGGTGSSMDTPAALAAASMLAAGGVAPGGYGKFVFIWGVGGFSCIFIYVSYVATQSLYPPLPNLTNLTISPIKLIII